MKKLIVNIETVSIKQEDGSMKKIIVDGHHHKLENAGSSLFEILGNIAAKSLAERSM